MSKYSKMVVCPIEGKIISMGFKQAVSNSNYEDSFHNAQKLCDAHIHLFPDRLMGAILDWLASALRRLTN